jgi:hypothetical protein
MTYQTMSFRLHEGRTRELIAELERAMNDVTCRRSALVTVEIDNKKIVRDFRITVGEAAEA